jgi:hypothetical protein
VVWGEQLHDTSCATPKNVSFNRVAEQQVEFELLGIDDWRYCISKEKVEYKSGIKTSWLKIRY